MGFTPVKPLDFSTFLHGKTTVFPTPFPDFQSNYGSSLQRETKCIDLNCPPLEEVVPSILLFGRGRRRTILKITFKRVIF
jgi:hypothetical protein